jgi:hypothetical protein
MSTETLAMIGALSGIPIGLVVGLAVAALDNKWRRAAR